MPRLPAAGLAGALLLAVAAPAQAQTSGGAAPPAQTTSAGGRVTAVTPRLGSWTVRSQLTAGRTATITGRLRRSRRGLSVVLQQRSGGRWTRVAGATSTPGGRLTLRWRPRSARMARVRLVRDRRATTRSGQVPAVAVRIQARVIATWYGPGLYGNRTACGQTLTPQLRGVAHRTLPCGTQVEIGYRGRRVLAPVVDRGPFANDATIDMTAPVADEVGARATIRVGFLPRRDLPRVSPAR